MTTAMRRKRVKGRGKGKKEGEEAGRQACRQAGDSWHSELRQV